jgi:glucans biosynthesis protein C
MNTVQESPAMRLHALDGVRATMMLLGLVLHSLIAYGQLDNRGAWPFKDAHTSILCDLIVYFIHLFRMPIFFIMSGFFASMLYERRSPMGLARNRASRILLPLIAGWIVLWPPIIMGYVFAIQAKSAPISQALVSAWRIISSRVPYELSTAHLWFLYYLLLFYVTFLVLVPAFGRLPERVRSAFMNGFSMAAASRFRPLWFAVPTAITLIMTPQGILLGPNSFVPDYRAYLGYLVFFAFGWLLFHRREILESYRHLAWANIAVGLLFFFVAITASAMAAAKKPGAHLVFVLCNALIVWLFAFGITGLFLRFLNRPRPAIRYVVDASYWVYLVHLPVVMWLMALMTPVEWPALAKGGTVLLGATVICFISYDLLARNTFIGKVLNGRRYSRGLPVVEAYEPAANLAVEQTTSTVE